jgi:hypothetical protein
LRQGDLGVHGCCEYEIYAVNMVAGGWIDWVLDIWPALSFVRVYTWSRGAGGLDCATSSLRVWSTADPRCRPAMGANHVILDPGGDYDTSWLTHKLIFRRSAVPHCSRRPTAAPPSPLLPRRHQHLVTTATQPHSIQHIIAIYPRSTPHRPM